MISIKVRNFRGCERAEISAGPIALVAGRNAAGKSSIAQAAGAALSGRALMLDLSKNMAGALVHAGAAEASVELRSETGTSRITWPGCDIVQSGSAPKASTFAAAFASVALLDPKERAQVLAEYLHSAPTRDDLAQELSRVELGEQRILDAVWQLIEANGWDAAHERRRETGATLKGRWRQVTGANYGSKRAQRWRPEDWTEDFEDATAASLDAEIVAARQAHEQAIAAVAVSGAERGRLAVLAAEIENLKDALADAEIEETRIEEGLRAAETARAALPAGGTALAMPCPHCGNKVVLRQINLAEARLEKAEDISETELKKRRLAAADADGTVARLRGQLGEQSRVVERARHAMQLALDARARLDNMPPGAVDDTAATATRLGSVERRAAAWKAWREAGELGERIRGNDLLLDILAPTGLRAKKLALVTDAFNQVQLQPLSEAAEWAAVTVDADQSMTIRYGGRPYALCSTSEQYRVRTVLAAAMARVDNSDMLVFDAADVLDGTTRSGLFALLEEAGLPALVCLTLTRREQAPDLAAIGLGASYWIEAGIAQPLPEMVKVAV